MYILKKEASQIRSKKIKNMLKDKKREKNSTRNTMILFHKFTTKRFFIIYNIKPNVFLLL
jgi:hypothetical protein